jgi:hypothetical protein
MSQELNPDLFVRMRPTIRRPEALERMMELCPVMHVVFLNWSIFVSLQIKKSSIKTSESAEFVGQNDQRFLKPPAKISSRPFGNHSFAGPLKPLHDP